MNSSGTVDTVTAPRDIELALKKQRLQLRSAALRQQMSGQAGALDPLFLTADRLNNGIGWLRRHPEAVVAAVVAIVVARPRRAFRWARRAFFAWQVWRRLQTWQAQNLR
jgi:hypothetical protein